jgi:hypothetical protein
VVTAAICRHGGQPSTRPQSWRQLAHAVWALPLRGHPVNAGQRPSLAAIRRAGQLSRCPTNIDAARKRPTGTYRVLDAYTSTPQRSRTRPRPCPQQTCRSRRTADKDRAAAPQRASSRLLPSDAPEPRPHPTTRCLELLPHTVRCPRLEAQRLTNLGPAVASRDCRADRLAQRFLHGDRRAATLVHGDERIPGPSQRVTEGARLSRATAGTVCSCRSLDPPLLLQVTLKSCLARR